MISDSAISHEVDMVGVVESVVVEVMAGTGGDSTDKVQVVEMSKLH